MVGTVPSRAVPTCAPVMENVSPSGAEIGDVTVTRDGTGMTAPLGWRQTVMMDWIMMEVRQIEQIIDTHFICLSHF